MLCRDGRLTQSQPEPAFCVVSSRCIKQIQAGGIFLPGPECTSLPRGLHPERNELLCDEGCPAIRRLLQGCRQRVIGCNLSEQATVSLSCCSEGCCMVSLRRRIYTLSGTAVDPCEIRVQSLRPWETYPLMAACCCLVLGDIPYEEGYMF